ncbi:MAG TPA: cyclase family protein [Amycolatopsis sp.]|uniref:cyclase family protein n=1 Tax=Amycolatopsis sp. TaxID=37632 RepID=UPI002B4A4530|nr:cyclase family protein [Amycolatopsis sp.]HJQ48795.1 cyclase family protein [Amycolatopsis sp.]HKS50203.1 cyclase family protein [Amycolatopsis sp.]
MPTRNNTYSLHEFGKAVRNLRAHDVSPTLGPDLAVFPPNPVPQARAFAEHSTHGVAANVWEIHEHSGSHVDAPFHYVPSGLTIDALPHDVLFFLPFKKFDLAPYDPQPGEPVGRDQLMEAAERGGFSLEDGDVAVLDFGWDRYLPGGTDAREPGWWGSNEPGLSEDACDYLAAAGISAVACDTSACDLSRRDGEFFASPGHTHYFLPNGILIVEGLRGLAEVPATGLFVALPLKLAKGTASPLRVLLLTE